MNRRGLLRSLSLLPIGAVAASLGIKATQAAPTTGVLRFPNDQVLAWRNAGIISRQTAAEAFGLGNIHYELADLAALEMEQRLDDFAVKLDRMFIGPLPK